MQTPGAPQVLVRSMVFIGGGHAHVHALKMMGMKPIPGVEVTLITRDVMTPYSGMLPGHIAGHYTKEECHIDLQKMASFAGANLVHAEAVGIDCEERLVRCNDGRPPIRFDVLSVDIGSTPKFVRSQDPAQLKHVTRVKPIDGFSARWDAIVGRFLGPTPVHHPRQLQPGNGVNSGSATGPRGAGGNGGRLMVVGGGAGGVELVLAMQNRLQCLLKERGQDPEGVTVGLINRGQTILGSHNKKVQQIFQRILKERGVEVHVGKEVISVKDPTPTAGGGLGALVCSDGSEVSFSEAIWCTHSGAASWLQETGLSLTKDGFIEVDDCLQSVNTPGVFACGDCCHMVNHPRPKAGVFAVRQGPPLSENLRRCLEGRPLKPYTPQKAFLGLISTGDRYAVMSRGFLAMEGRALWDWKDHIDVTWMKKYQELPVMDPKVANPNPKGEKEGSSRYPKTPPAVAAAGPRAVEVLENASMRCGGCGSKVGASLLARVLSKLGVQSAPGGRGGGDDAAIVRLPLEPGAALVQTVDFFRKILSDPYLFGRIAANHALSDVYAMGAVPTSALAIATIPHGGERQVEGALEQLLAGALSTLEQEGCTLLGGHTCEGSELALGLTVNGVATGGEGSLLKKTGAEAGDVLVLTKAIGTGAVLAAEMRGQASAAWVQGAVGAMLQGNRAPAEVLRAQGAHACTDVTGFGLMGHLAEMMTARSAPQHLVSNPNPDHNPDHNPNPNPNRSLLFASSSPMPQCSRCLQAEVDVDSVPILPGALEAVERGIVSSLQGQNERDAEGVVVAGVGVGVGQGLGSILSHPRYRILFDPQTAGGLLAAVPPENAGSCIAALVEAGCEEAAVIGRVKRGRGDGGEASICLIAASDK
ncbi:unnamed protein product [Discosporangium mesarthrocarpum]